MTDKTPQRYLNILTILNDSVIDKYGLTTAEIVKQYHERFGNSPKDPDSINDSTLMSKCMYILRGLKQITSSDTAEGKKHRITKIGRDKLAEHAKLASAPAMNKFDNLIEFPILMTNETKTEPVATNSLTGQATDSPESLIELLDQLDNAFKIIRQAVVEASTPKPVTIKNRRLKIGALKRLEPILSQDIGELINDIIVDLETI